MPPTCDGDLGSTSADAEVAVLTFTAGATEGQAYVRFRPDEVNLYKAKKDKGLKGFLEDRSKTASRTAEK